jgi:aminoglycoside phosphotransferase (APT) family kinase protein
VHREKDEIYPKDAFVHNLAYPNDMFLRRNCEVKAMCIYQKIVSRMPIHKGWSIDQKYCVTTEDGQKYLLRISPIDRLERKKREFEQMGQVAKLDIPMCLPLEFGTCEEGAYSIQSWVEGVDAKDIVIDMDAAEQYRYGWDAGHILARIHTIYAPADVPAWETRFNAKIDRYIALYEACELKYEGNDQAFLDYLANNRHLLVGRPQCYQHGDYHIGNMMIDQNGILTIIDFDRDDYGDPWEEFNRIVWCAQEAPAFASGMVDGYFNSDVPMEFWKLLALYISSNTLGYPFWRRRDPGHA